MLTLDAEYLLPGHGLPVMGSDRVAQALGGTAELLESLVEQTLEIMNNGGRLDEAIHSVEVPSHLAGLSYLRPIYDEPEFIVHNIWRLYGGWWDGNPATLKPAPEVALASEVAALAGGPGALAARALELLNQPAPTAAGPDTEGALRLAGHLAEMAWLADPSDPAIADARQRVFTTRAEHATSTMAKGVFNWAARTSSPED
jgi:alkyl sulfatase BDS1-like metallo-beta-lactamase superfamily hydrolase